jgi:opacity protein-like surface antigen
MKKILLTTVAVAALSTSAFAEMGLGEDSFYLRADVLGNKYNKVSARGNSYKSEYDMGLDVGAGYRVMDNMRTELVYNYAFNPKLKHDETNNSSKVKINAQSLTLRGLVDFADLGMAKLYAGAGLGWAQVGAKLTDTAVPAKAKNTNNLAWSLHAGSGFSVADGVTLDVGYSFRDYGKTKEFANNGGKVTVRSHNLSAGVRFDI